MTGIDGSPSEKDLAKNFQLSRKICQGNCSQISSNNPDDSEDQLNDSQKHLCRKCKGLKLHSEPSIEGCCICCDKKLFKSDIANFPCTACHWSVLLNAASACIWRNKTLEIVNKDFDDTPANVPIEQLLIARGVGAGAGARAGTATNADPSQLGLDPANPDTPRTVAANLAARESMVLQRAATQPDSDDDDEEEARPSKKRKRERQIKRWQQAKEGNATSKTSRERMKVKRKSEVHPRGR